EGASAEAWSGACQLLLRARAEGRRPIRRGQQGASGGSRTVFARPRRAQRIGARVVPAETLRGSREGAPENAGNRSRRSAGKLQPDALLHRIGRRDARESVPRSLSALQSG